VAVVYVDDPGKQYRQKVRSILAGVSPMGGKVRVLITSHPPDKRRRDLDNILKCLLDSLTHAGVWDDDSQVDELAVIRGEIVPGGKVKVVVEVIDKPGGE
jgi:crossover junction endodeoxyribonuclease RusA